MKKGRNLKKEFLIPFGGQKIGNKHYSFTVDRSFFEDDEAFIDCESAELSVEFDLDKQSSILTLLYDIDGWLELPCDRCGDLMKQPIAAKEKMFVKFTEGGFDNTDDVITLPSSETHLYIWPYILEFITLAIPMRVVHEEGFCNEEVLKTLQEFNIKEEEISDPRWGALDDLKKKLENGTS